MADSESDTNSHSSRNFSLRNIASSINFLLGFKKVSPNYGSSSCPSLGSQLSSTTITAYLYQHRHQRERVGISIGRRRSSDSLNQLSSIGSLSRHLGQNPLRLIRRHAVYFRVIESRVQAMIRFCNMFCYRCGDSLRGKDVFMYRDQGFCSLKCRYDVCATDLMTESYRKQARRCSKNRPPAKVKFFIGGPQKTAEEVI